MMSEPLLLGSLFLVVAVFYSSVGLGGGSSYTAILALTALPATQIAPVALSLNIIVAGLALWSFAGENHFKLELALPLVITSIPASIYGASIAVNSDTVLLVLAIALGLASTVLWKRGQVLRMAQSDRATRISTGFLMGLILGVLAGMTGIGGGIFLVPVIILLGWASEKEAAAVGAAFVWLNSAAGLSAHLWQGNVPTGLILPLAASVAIGALIGSQLGAKWIKKSTVRRVVAVLLMLVSVRLVLTLAGVQ